MTLRHSATGAQHACHRCVVCVQESSTCHYVLNVAVPGLCQLPTFQQETEPITQIVCKVVASPAAKEPTIDPDAVTDQQQQLHAEAVEDIAELASEISTNGTEQVCSGFGYKLGDMLALFHV